MQASSPSKPSPRYRSSLERMGCMLADEQQARMAFCWLQADLSYSYWAAGQAQGTSLVQEKVSAGDRGCNCTGRHQQDRGDP